MTNPNSDRIEEHRRRIRKLLRDKRMFLRFRSPGWQDRVKQCNRRLSHEYRYLCKLQKIPLSTLHEREPELFATQIRRTPGWEYREKYGQGGKT